MGQTIEISTPDGAAEAYLTGEVGRPGVLFYVDAIGLRPQIQEMADRIASWGYVVLAPHVFYRDGRAADLAPQGDLREPGAREAFFAGGVMDRVGALTPDRADPDAAAWVAALPSHAGHGPDRGHRLLHGCTARGPDGRVVPRHVVAAVGGFHGGRLVTDDADSPHLAIAGPTAAFAFGHADQDSSMPVEQVEALEQALQAGGREHVNEIYPGAAHGYSMADTASYAEAGTERHFTVLRELFDRTL